MWAQFSYNTSPTFPNLFLHSRHCLGAILPHSSKLEKGRPQLIQWKSSCTSWCHVRWTSDESAQGTAKTEKLGRFKAIGGNFQCRWLGPTTVTTIPPAILSKKAIWVALTPLLRILSGGRKVATGLLYPHARIHPVFMFPNLNASRPRFQSQFLSYQNSPQIWRSKLTREALLGVRGTTPLEVLIKWHNLPREEATWENYDVLQHQFPSFHLEDKMSLWAAHCYMERRMFRNVVRKRECGLQPLE